MNASPETKADVRRFSPMGLILASAYIDRHFAPFPVFKARAARANTEQFQISRLVSISLACGFLAQRQSASQPMAVP
jgi:hypothetical protein